MPWLYLLLNRMKSRMSITERNRLYNVSFSLNFVVQFSIVARKMNGINEHEKYMAQALREARKAARIGEIPIGAVIVKDGSIVGRGYNRVESGKDPTLHAEMIAIRRAASKLGVWRLIGCTMYVTVEPCSMCAGAAVLARLGAVVAGAKSDKSGACGSVKDILDSDSLNHRVDYMAGVLEQDCAALLGVFFKGLRERRSE